MKKLLSIGLVAVLAIFVFAAASAQDEGKKANCPSACKTSTVAEKGNCDKGAAKATKTAAADCCDDEKGAAVTRVADAITVTGTPVSCPDTMGKVAEKNGLCPKGTPASGKSVLLRTADGGYVLVSAKCRIALPEKATAIRAHGTLSGSHLIAATLEVQDDSGAWKSVPLEQTGA